MLDCAYLPEELAPRCGRWHSFIDEITSHDKEKANYLQKALGYSLLGENTKECMFVAYGAKTRNGKGTLFNTIARVLGLGKENGYGSTMKSGLICESKYKEKDYNAAEPMLADTVGIRYLTLSETKDDITLDEAAIKSLTGRDPLKTRQLHSSAFVFTPQFTIWLSTNFLPRVNDDSVFKSDRIWVIPFNEHFDEQTRDENLKELFIQPNNKVTVLRWLIEGYKKFVAEGLTPPECVREATLQYARTNDRILCFKEDCLEDAPGEKVSNALMYAQYKSWCADEERSYSPMGTTSFYKKLGKYYSRQDANGFRGFVNVKLKRQSDMVVIK
jgi:putative DNA primase/helicase